MASEIRVNKITHTAGVGTITTNADGINVIGIVTATTFSGNISGATGTFTGNLNVGGVLTYEDVTNVDSVGVITARSGIRIGATGANTLINGNTAGIGIGTANPQSILDISKDISAGVNEVNIRNHHPTGGAALRVKTQGTYGSPSYQAILGASDAGGTIRVGAVSNHPLLLLTNNTERVRIASDGKVGVGTDSPLSVLTAYGENRGEGTVTGQITAKDDAAYNASPTGGLIFQGKYASNSAQAIFAGVTGFKENATDGNYAGALAFHTRANGSVAQERLRITSSGQLLLGETSAYDSNTAVQFTKNVSGNQARFIFRNNANNSNSRVQLQCMTLNRASNADTVSGIEKYQSGGMAIYNGENTNQYSTMGFFCNGYRSLLLKNGNHSGYDVAHFYAYWGTSNGIQMEVGGPQSGTHKAIRFYTSHYGGERGYIGVTLGGTSYNSSSDYRQKQDVVDLTGAIDRVKSFKPRRFKWKDDPTYTVDGFLAHEAQTVVPESVVGEKDAVDENGDAEYQVIDQSKLVPLLTAALQEAITEIETLKTKVAALESS